MSRRQRALGFDGACGFRVFSKKGECRGALEFDEGGGLAALQFLRITDDAEWDILVPLRRLVTGGSYRVNVPLLLEA